MDNNSLIFTLGFLLALYTLWNRFGNAKWLPEIFRIPLDGTRQAEKIGASVVRKTNASHEYKNHIDSNLDAIVLYYTQSGTAKNFSERLVSELQQYSIRVCCYDVEMLDSLSALKLKFKFIVFVTATYGNGDPPDTAAKFHELLFASDLPDDYMQDVNYAVFGLGDKTYESYNKIGRSMFKRIKRLGGLPLCKLGKGDANTDIENDFSNWKTKFLLSIEEKFLLVKQNLSSNVDSSAFCESIVLEDRLAFDGNSSEDLSKIYIWKHKDDLQLSHDLKNPYLATILRNDQVYNNEYGVCKIMEISIKENMSYEPGDHLGLYPLNDEESVKLLLERLGFDGEKIVKIFSSQSQTLILGPCTLFAALMGYYNISSPLKKPMLSEFLKYIDSEHERNAVLSMISDNSEYKKHILDSNGTFYDFLQKYKSCSPPIDCVLKQLPKLQPRYYSIASSPKIHQNKVHIIYKVVQHFNYARGCVCEGVATSWLSRRKASTEDQISKVPVFVRKSKFKLPAQLSIPIIMIGPGTGLAPFVGFLQERVFDLHQQNSDSLNVLFFGCKHPDKDFICKNEIEVLVEQKKLVLYTAFSRIEEKKNYVQHVMSKKEVGSYICNIIKNQGGCVYVCGDGRSMYKDVNSALKQVMACHGDMDLSVAKEYIKNMKNQGRFMIDVW